MRKIAIIGKCSSTRSDAPIFDPSWEVWALAWDPLPVAHRYFELHESWRFHRGDKDDAEAHTNWIKSQRVPVYMRQTEGDVPASVAYPFDDVEKIIRKSMQGFVYLESSIAYMLALAMLEEWERPDNLRVGIWGVDMGTTTEYAYQRPNMEYLIGKAEGRGMKVWVPPQSSLLTSAHDEPYGLWLSSPNPLMDAQAA